MRRGQHFPKGVITRISVESEALKNNMLGDDAIRECDVYVPHGADPAGLPLLLDAAAYTSSGLAHTGWKGFDENLPERLDRLIATGEMKPAVVLFPDCFTRLGGNQYVNSSAMGNWADFLIKELVPTVEDKLKCGGAGKRGIFGISSGGYAAMVHGMFYADFWSAIACHSGDMGFDMAYAAGFPTLLRKLAKHENSIEKFVGSVNANHNPGGEDIHALMLLAMAASYDPNPNTFCGIQLPVDSHTCEIIDERWQEWLKWDPLQLVDAYTEQLKSLKAVWLDCGDVDQFNFVYPARKMTAKLAAAGVRHRYEEFPDNHFSISYRLDRSLPYLVDAFG